MGRKKKCGRKWILGVITAIGTIIAVEAAGLGHILASALTAPTPEAANIWWAIGCSVMGFLTTLELLHKR